VLICGILLGSCSLRTEIRPLLQHGADLLHERLIDLRHLQVLPAQILDQRVETDLEPLLEQLERERCGPGVLITAPELQLRFDEGLVPLLEQVNCRLLAVVGGDQGEAELIGGAKPGRNGVGSARVAAGAFGAVPAGVARTIQPLPIPAGPCAGALPLPLRKTALCLRQPWSRCAATC
jgi:hypothetical protein